MDSHPTFLAPMAVALLLQSSVAGNVPSMPLKSADGCFMVTAAADNPASRAAVLDFAEDVRNGLRRLTGWRLEPLYRPILIALDCEDVAEIRRAVFLSKEGAIRAQIEIPPAESMESATLAREVVSVLARVELARHTEPGRTPADFPEWFLAGLARQMDLSARQPDFEYAWARWSRGRLVSAWELSGRDSLSQGDDATAALLVSWLLDHPEAKAACAGLLRLMGDGREWSPELVAECFGLDREPSGFDEDWDIWMLERSRKVLEPGTTPAGAVRRCRSQLLIYPRDSGIPYGGFGMNAVTPEELALEADSPAARRMAGRKAKAIVASVIGRDRTLRETAGLFAAALDAVAEGDSAAALAALSAARRGQRAIEAAAAAGKTLGTDSRGDVAAEEEWN